MAPLPTPDRPKYPGWYPDPGRPESECFYNGTEFTDLRRPIVFGSASDDENDPRRRFSNKGHMQTG